MTIKVLKSLRNDDRFSAFWESILMKAKDFDVNEPILPHKRRRSQRYEDGGLSSDYHSDTAEHHFKLMYFEALDLSVSCI